MAEITLIEDLAQKKITVVPEYILKLKNLRMLYLEGNNLIQIPEALFKNLENLLWLDLRNNKLKTIPATVQFHLNLETLLLQNNKIERIPLELGFVPKLQVLQISGNPIIYPKKSILEKGLQSIVKFLQDEYAIEKLNSNTSSTSSDYNDVDEFENETENYSSQSKNVSATGVPIVTLKSYHKFMYRTPRKKEKSKKVNKAKSKSNFYSIKDTPHSNSNKCLSMIPNKKNELRIQEQFLKDIWLKKLKEIMTNQQTMIQKLNDQKVLKKWRQTKQYQMGKLDTKYRPEIPYDSDPKFDQIPMRNELIRMRLEKSSKRVLPANKPKKINIEKMINDIIESLKEMEVEKNIEKSPAEQMDYAGREIRRILDLQKRISALKIQNSQMF